MSPCPLRDSTTKSPIQIKHGSGSFKTPGVYKKESSLLVSEVCPRWIEMLGDSPRNKRAGKCHISLRSPTYTGGYLQETAQLQDSLPNLLTLLLPPPMHIADPLPPKCFWPKHIQTGGSGLPECKQLQQRTAPLLSDSCPGGRGR